MASVFAAYASLRRQRSGAPAPFGKGVDRYAQFGGLVNQADRTVSFKLFFPDATSAPSQCEGGALPRVRVPENAPWQDLINGAMVTPENGWLRSTVGSNWGAIDYRRD
jgi:hypothetical protein